MKTVMLTLAIVALPVTAATAMTSRPKDPKLASCGADRVQRFVGKQSSPELRRIVERTARAERARWITPETMVTQDYRPSRLNAHLGTDGRIGSFSCG